MKKTISTIAILLFVIFCAVGSAAAKPIIERGELIIQLKQGAKVTASWLQAGRKGAIPELNAILPNGYTTEGYFSDKFFNNNSKRDELLSSNSKRMSFERTVLVRFDGNTDPALLASKISGYEFVEYAEPVFERHFVGMENDSLNGLQYYLSMVNSDSAKAYISSRDTIVVGVVDTGVDYTHEDLAANIYANPGETGTDADGKDKRTNGIDDDSNGYVDDWRGWDFVGADGSIYKEDNDPYPGHNHGTHVSGTFGAVLNNGIGIAGVAKNVKILPVKIGSDNPNATATHRGMEAMMYASDMKVNIINCSWGGEGYSITEASLIDYITSSGTLVVGAAGNDGSSEEFYPANYNGVLSVAAVDGNWNYAYFTNYGPWVDISAPGVNILSTITGSLYGNMSGTSMATPVTVGCAALAMLAHPNYNSRQIRELLKSTANKKIYEYYPEYVGYFGTGVVDALAAVKATNVYGIDLSNYNFTKNGDTNRVAIGDKFYINLKFKNILDRIGNVTVAVAPRKDNSNATANYITMNSNTYAVGSMEANEIKTLDSVFAFTAAAEVPGDYKFQFYVYFINGNDTIRTELIYTRVNRSYINFSNNDITITINSRGNYAFNDYPMNRQGIGMTYKDSGSLLFEGATMLTTSFKSPEDSAFVIDVARSANSNQDRRFSIKKIVDQSILNSNWKIASTTYQSDVIEELPTFPYTFDVTCNTFASSGEADKNYIICEYNVTNTSANDIDSCYLGMFFDWDIGISGRNCIAEYDEDNGIAWNFSSEDSTLPVTGVKSLSSYPVNYYGIENNNNDDTDIGVYNGFTNAEKFKTLTSGIANHMTNAADISQVISAGPFPLKSGETKKIPFAVFAGKTFSDLAAAADRAKNYQTLAVEEIAESKQLNVFPNPTDGKEITLAFDCPQAAAYSLELVDITGNSVNSYFSGKIIAVGSYTEKINLNGISSGTYFLKLRNNNKEFVKKIVVKK